MEANAAGSASDSEAEPAALAAALRSPKPELREEDAALAEAGTPAPAFSPLVSPSSLRWCSSTNGETTEKPSSVSPFSVVSPLVLDVICGTSACPVSFPSFKVEGNETGQAGSTTTLVSSSSDVGGGRGVSPSDGPSDGHVFIGDGGRGGRRDPS